MASHPAVLLIVLLFCTYGVKVSWSQYHNSTALSIQIDTLFAEYDREVPPPSSGALEVHVTLNVNHANIDQEQSVMRLLADLHLVWVDKRLRWNQTEWGCDYAITAAERLWLPDIVLMNAAATGVSTAPSDVGLRARLNYDGAITWAMRLDLTAPLELQLYDWPEDTQSCIFRFAPRSYSSDQIELKVIEAQSAVVFESGTWEIQTINGDTLKWDRGEEETSVALWMIVVKRRAPAHALAANTVLIASALVLAAAISLPPDQRHALAACASFIATLWMITALLRLPGAHTCPRVLSLMCAMCICGALCSACAAFVRRVANCPVPPPRLLRGLLSSLSTICRLTPSPEACTSSESGAWAAASVLADRTLCGALLLTLLVLLAVQLL
ncbi:unnamed protein product [Arctia plantaginis]|uniref:Neurotransmitter-gated ion-channel ligand-binding domain-containing protein n=1 Tax=Arctia plantaginis TaxID=874455 RepID=A0A8S0Z132_ARCPL|nr:unnamed protein product [Arctia plantaginis]